MALAPWQTEDFLTLFFGIEHVTPVNANPNFQGVIDSVFYRRLLQGRTVPELAEQYDWVLNVIEAGPPQNFISQPNWSWQQLEVLATLVGLRVNNYVYSVHVMNLIRNDDRYQAFLGARTADAMLSKLNREHRNLRNRYLRLRNEDLQAAINNQQEGGGNNQLEGGGVNIQEEQADNNQQQQQGNQNEGEGVDNNEEGFAEFVQTIEVRLAEMEETIFDQILELYTQAMEYQGFA